MPPGLRDDQGASLILALAFLAGFGLVGSSILYLMNANERATEQVRSIDNAAYAADGGLDYAIDALRRNDSNCPNAAAGTQSLGSVPIGGVSVTVQCQAFGPGDAGGGLGASQYAIITTDPGPNSLTTQSGGIPFVSGPGTGLESPHVVTLYVAGGMQLKYLQVQGGDVDQFQSPLSTPPCGAAPNGLTVVAPYQYCHTGTPTPDFPNALPTAHPAAAPAYWAKSSTCRVFYPGTYTSAPAHLEGVGNYFASGVYYFDNIGQWQTTAASTSIVGGAQGTDTLAAEPPFVPPCSNDAEAQAHNAGPALSGSGVKFILGGTSSFSVKAGIVELFTRVGPAGEGAAGFSLQQVRASQSDSFWLAPNLGSSNLLETLPGNNTQVAINGTIYAPEGNVAFFATNTVLIQLLGGVVAKDLTLQASASIGARALRASYAVSLGSVRTVLIRATPANGAPYQGVVSVSPGSTYAARTAVVVTWRKCSPSGC